MNGRESEAQAHPRDQPRESGARLHTPPRGPPAPAGVSLPSPPGVDTSSPLLTPTPAPAAPHRGFFPPWVLPTRGILPFLWLRCHFLPDRGLSPPVLLSFTPSTGPVAGVSAPGQYADSRKTLS